MRLYGIYINGALDMICGAAMLYGSAKDAEAMARLRSQYESGKVEAREVFIQGIVGG